MQHRYPIVSAIYHISGTLKMNLWTHHWWQRAKGVRARLTTNGDVWWALEAMPNGGT